jgi:Ca2+-binding EF-hand superfamily protein
MKTRTHIPYLLSSTLFLGFGVTACQRDEPAPRTVTENAPVTAPAAAPSAAMPRDTETAAVTVPYVATCEPSAELSGMLTRLSATADANGDGRIDKQEAYSSADFLVGGFFFRADTNNDGTISPEEGRTARSELAARHPQLAMTVKTMAGPDPSATTSRLADMLGVDYGEPVSSKQLRDMGHQAVDQLFEMADRDKNGSLTRAEVEEAGRERMRTAAQATFSAADANNDQKVALDEFRAALERPVRQAFELADANKDGSLTTAEAAEAARAILQRLGAPIQAEEAKPGTTSSAK